MTGIAQDELFGILGIHGEDAVACAALLASPPGDGTRRALAVLDARLGTFPIEPASAEGCTETDWIEALLRFAPVVHGHHLSPRHSAGSLRRYSGRVD